MSQEQWNRVEIDNTARSHTIVISGIGFNWPYTSQIRISGRRCRCTTDTSTEKGVTLNIVF
jgi:hypothetical protein